MGYIVFNVDDRDAINVRSSTDGYQPKFLTNNKSNFIKVQCELQRTLRNDWRVEDIASRICEKLGIYAVKQTPCRVNIRNSKGAIKTRLGVVSRNFENFGYSFISYSRLLDLHKINTDDKEFTKRNAIDKLKMIINNMSEASGISKEALTKYMFDMITVDLLVLNQDRHFRNFGVFWNSKTNNYEIAMLFDFGMGLFENDTHFDTLSTLNDCMRYSYIAPFGEDPFELLDMLKTVPLYMRYLKSINIQRINISNSLFTRDIAREYFLEIKRKMVI